MAIPSETLGEREAAAARGVVYGLLARSFAYPSPEHLDVLRDRIRFVVRELVTSDAVLDGLLAEVARGLKASLDELRDAHALLFTHIEPVDYPPYESAYCSADIFRQADTMADVAAFYLAHGLQVGGVERERPDHVATELDFMGLMAVKEAYALEHLGSEQVDECRRTQDHFLRDHLGCWAPGLGQRLATLAQHPFHRALGALLAHWLEADMANLGVEPVVMLDEPIPPTEIDDGACGIDTACFAEDSADAVPVEIGPRRER
ncbi:MAG TPA: molecular chaperone TorD family protein [Nocardioidaceae bacterium]|nr:molecular chaperone TorD family protein [Nocardioidaceae bacterium]